MELELKKLVDERAISNQLSRLARILDSRDWDRLGDVYAQEVVFTYPGEAPQKGVATLRANLEEFLDNCGPTQHIIGGDLITTFEGNTAKSSVYGQAFHQGKGNNAHLFYNLYGSYSDEWEKQGNEWKIVKREFSIFQAQGDIDAMGTSKNIKTQND